MGVHFLSLEFVEVLEKLDIARENVFSLIQTRLYVIGPPSIIFDCTAEASLANQYVTFDASASS